MLCDAEHKYTASIFEINWKLSRRLSGSSGSASYGLCLGKQEFQTQKCFLWKHGVKLCSPSIRRDV